MFLLHACCRVTRCIYQASASVNGDKWSDLYPVWNHSKHNDCHIKYSKCKYFAKSYFISDIQVNNASLYSSSITHECSLVFVICFTILYWYRWNIKVCMYLSYIQFMKYAFCKELWIPYLLLQKTIFLCYCPRNR